ncbi:unnamed protein product, partial [Staurois parvus]
MPGVLWGSSQPPLDAEASVPEVFTDPDIRGLLGWVCRHIQTLEQALEVDPAEDQPGLVAYIK